MNDYLKKIKEIEQSKDPHELENLSDHPDHVIRAYVACNKHTPEHVLMKLAVDKYYVVKYSVFNLNENCTEAVVMFACAHRLLVRLKTDIPRDVLRLFPKGAD